MVRVALGGLLVLCGCTRGGFGIDEPDLARGDGAPHSDAPALLDARPLDRGSADRRVPRDGPRLPDLKPPKDLKPPPDQKLADSAPKPKYSCSVDLNKNTTTCAAPVTLLALQGGQGRFRVDLNGLKELVLKVQICNPSNFTLHLGDSPTNDGYGGDSGTFSNDAELHVTGTALLVYGNDYIAPNPADLFADQTFVPATGCVDRALRVGDGYLHTLVPTHSLISQFLLRLNQPDSEGTPDAIFWLGLNRVVNDPPGARVGTGLQTATIELY